MVNPRGRHYWALIRRDSPWHSWIGRGMLPRVMPSIRLALCLTLPLLALGLGMAGDARATCDCGGTPFSARSFARISRDAQMLGSLGVNDPGGRALIAFGAFMPPSTSVSADRVTVGRDASIGNVNANLFKIATGATVGAVNAVGLPLETPYCDMPLVGCGLDDVIVTDAAGVTELTPGTYGRLRIGKGGFVRLEPGTYDFCDVSISRTSVLLADGAVTINAFGTVKVATQGSLVASIGSPRPILNARSVKVVFGTESVVEAELRAPDATMKLGRAASFDGCFCANKVKAGKLSFVTCAASPSGAFLD
jgi:hypothetical protein